MNKNKSIYFKCTIIPIVLLLLPIVSYASKDNNSSDCSSWLNPVCTLIGAALGAIISGLIATWTFNKGIKEQKEKEKRDLVDFADYIAKCNRSICKAINSQIDSFNTSHNEIDADPLIDMVVKRIPIGYDILKQIDTYKLYRALTLKGFKPSRINDYIYAINFLSSVFNSFDIQLTEYRENIHYRNDNLGKNWIILVGIMTDIANKIKDTNPKISEEIWKKLQIDDEKQSQRKSFEKMIHSVYLYISEEPILKSECQKNHEEINSLIFEIREDFLDIKDINKELSENLKNICTHLKETISIFNDLEKPN